jgi:23S rRNA (guanosine2251-2'-O)-methyltransferase
VRVDGGPSRGRVGADLVAGRNPVLEALRAGVPARALYVARGLEAEPRVRDVLRLAADRGVPVVPVARAELDRLAAAHQGVLLRVPGYRYRHPDDLLAAARASGRPALILACDGVTDPHNLGALARSVAAFGGHGLLLPERRSAGVTAAAWKASAGALSRVPVARATNLVRTLRDYGAAGLVVAGLAPSGELVLQDLPADDALVVVVGGEGKGLSRLVGERCDVRVRIALATGVESLNAAVAGGIALHAIAMRRRARQATAG